MFFSFNFIAYKYRYGHDEALVGEKIVGLLRIVIHTLAAQAHVCDRYSKPIVGMNMRSRDLSSLGGETDQNFDPADPDDDHEKEHIHPHDKDQSTDNPGSR